MHRQAALTKSSCSLKEISEKQLHENQPSTEGNKVTEAV